MNSPSATSPLVTPLPAEVYLAIEAGPNGDERLNDEWKRRELFALRIARMAYEAGRSTASETVEPLPKRLEAQIHYMNRQAQMLAEEGNDVSAGVMREACGFLHALWHEVEQERNFKYKANLRADKAEATLSATPMPVSELALQHAEELEFLVARDEGFSQRTKNAMRGAGRFLRATPSATRWLATADRLPMPNVPVVGDWSSDRPDDRMGSLQVCMHDGTRWVTFDCGSYHSRLIAPTYWMPVLPLYVREKETP